MSVERQSKLTSRAELVLWLQQSGESIDSIHSVARFAGFQWQEESLFKPKRMVTESVSTVQQPEQTVVLPRIIANSQRVTARWFRVAKHSRLQADDIDATLNPDEPFSIQGISDFSPEELESSDQPPLVLQPLVNWARLWPVLKRSLSADVERDVDFTRLVQQVSRGEWVRHLPKQSRPYWSSDMVLLLDFNTRVLPFWDDFHQLHVALSNLRGKQGLKVCKYGEGDWVMPAPEIPVLILSDLGMLEASGVLRKQWLRFGCALKAAGIQPFVLAPVSPQHIDPELGSYYHIALWGRSSRLLRQRQRVEVDNYPQLEELLALLSPAIRIEPELLRAVRHLLPDAEFDTGIEAAFWQHSDMDVSPVACALRPESVEKHRINFKVQSPNLQRDVLKLIRQHHAHLFAAIMHEETLIWAELVSDELVMEFQQEIQQANIFLRKTAKMFYSQREHLGDSYKAYGKRLVNRAHKGLRQQHDALAVVAAVYSMDELREKRSVLPPEGINRQEWERVLAQGNKQRRECVLYQYGDELRLAENNADTPLGSFVAEMTLTNDLLSVQTETVDGETSELYFQGNTDEIFLTSLEQNIQQLTLQSGDETLILRGFNKPDWVHRMGRDSKGLWIEFSQHNKEYRIYWPVWGSELGYDEYGLYADIIINGITQRCRWIPPGEFLMGSPKKEIGRLDHEIQHSVTITQGYWLADTTCTQFLWEAVMGNNPAYFREDKNNPVEQVSWDNAQDFFKRLSTLIPGLDAHLPTEAQWEYACRAGTITPFSFGENITPTEVNYDGDSHREKTVPVKSLPPNPWGLYEMHGNVWEWCDDWHNTYPAKPVVDPIGKTSFIRVLRGGAANQNSRYVRSAHRHGSTPDHCGNTFGFRFALGKVNKSAVKPHRKPSVYTIGN
jgi:hypothetical protein